MHEGALQPYVNRFAAVCQGRGIVGVGWQLFGRAGSPEQPAGGSMASRARAREACADAQFVGLRKSSPTSCSAEALRASSRRQTLKSWALDERQGRPNTRGQGSRTLVLIDDCAQAPAHSDRHEHDATARELGLDAREWKLPAPANCWAPDGIHAIAAYYVG